MLAKNYHVAFGVSRGVPAGAEPVSVLDCPEQTRPSFPAFHDRYLRNFTHSHVPKAEHVESLTLTVALSPAEALDGCTIPVGIPVFAACPDCAGTGHVLPFLCVACAGSGLVEREGILEIYVPPFVQPGAILEAPLDLLGIDNLYLRIQVSISDTLE